MMSLTHYIDRLVASQWALSNSQQQLGTVLYSSNKPAKLLQWLCYDESTIDTVIVIVIIIITIIQYYYYYTVYFFINVLLFINKLFISK